MLTLSATDLAIAVAYEAGTLTTKERPSRLGGTYVAIADDFGTIEVQNTWQDWHSRLDAIVARIKVAA